jgi:hypothetical protein
VLRWVSNTRNSFVETYVPYENSRITEVAGFAMFLRVTECRVVNPVEISSPKQKRWCVLTGLPLMGEWERSYCALNAIAYAEPAGEVGPSVLSFQTRNNALQFSQIPVSGK